MKCPCFSSVHLFYFSFLRREKERNGLVGLYTVATPLPAVQHRQCIRCTPICDAYTRVHVHAYTAVPTRAAMRYTQLRHGENETDISAGSAPAGVGGHPRGELLYLISRGGRTLIKRPQINNVESRARSRVAPRSIPLSPHRVKSLPYRCLS